MKSLLSILSLMMINAGIVLFTLLSFFSCSINEDVPISCYKGGNRSRINADTESSASDYQAASPTSRTSNTPLKYLTICLDDDVTMDFVLIPSGEASIVRNPLGKSNNGVDTVRISQAYYIGTCAVTQQQWHAVMCTNPSSSRDPFAPVTDISWNDCQEYCQRLSLKQGTIFQLPTENEWSYACCTSYLNDQKIQDKVLITTTRSSTNSSDQCKNNIFQGTSYTDIGAHVIYDAHDGVREWCADWWPSWMNDVNPSSKPQSALLPLRIIAGASWAIGPDNRHCTLRSSAYPYDTSDDVGFRIAFGGDTLSRDKTASATFNREFTRGNSVSLLTQTIHLERVGDTAQVHGNTIRLDDYSAILRSCSITILPDNIKIHGTESTYLGEGQSLYLEKVSNNGISIRIQWCE